MKIEQFMIYSALVLHLYKNYRDSLSLP